MPDDFPKDQIIDKQIVLAAIKAVKDKGWDLNPFTVADEAHIPPTLLYRSSEMMELIVQERGGSFGTGLDSSLNVASEWKDLAQSNDNLKDNVGQPEQNFGDDANLSPDTKMGFGEGDPMPSPSQKQALNEAPSSANASSSQEKRKNGQNWQIYNLAKNGPVSSEFNPLATLTWKDIETVYYMRVSTLRDYASNIPGPNENAHSTWFSDQSGPTYRPYLSAGTGAFSDGDHVTDATQAPGSYPATSFLAPSAKPSNGDSDPSPGIASPEMAKDQAPPPSSFTPGQFSSTPEVDHSGALLLSEATPIETTPPPETAADASTHLFSKVIEEATSDVEAEADRQVTPTEIISLPEAATGAPSSLYNEPSEAKARAREADSSQPGERKEISPPPEAAAHFSAAPQTKPREVKPALERPSSPFVTSDNIPALRSSDKASSPPESQPTPSTTPAGEDASVSPFQKLKTSSSWPRPSTSYSPIDLQQILGKGGTNQEPQAPPPPTPKVKQSAQEMIWEHFADSPSPPIETAPTKAKIGAVQEPRLPDKAFTDLFNKKTETPALPPEQLAWGHFAQSEAASLQASQANAAYSEQFSSGSPFDQGQAPSPDEPGSTTAAASEAATLPASLFDPATVKPDGLAGAPVDLPLPTPSPPIAGPEASEAQIYSDVSLAGPHYSFGTAYSFDYWNKSKPVPKPGPEEIKTQELGPLPVDDKSEANKSVRQPFTFAPEPESAGPLASVPSESVEEVPDLDALDIFDDLDNLTDMAEIEIIEEVVKDQVSQKANGLTSTISGDELRELIKSRIKQASEQLAEPPAEVSSEPAGETESSKQAANRSKFVGAAKTHEPPKTSSFVPRTVPAEIRKACLLLGVRPEELTKEMIIEAWKRQIASPGVHPDLGGDTESAIYLNTAKDTLIRWLEAQAPKLGKRFGQTVKTRAQTNTKKGSDKTDKPDKADKLDKADKAKKAEKSE